MKKLKSQIAAILLVTIGFDYCEALEEKTDGSKVLICYVDKRSERRRVWAFNIEDIHAPFCTHLAYAFANVGPLNDYEGRYRNFNDIKNANPKLKTLLSVGDIFHGNYKTFEEMVADDEVRREFVANSASFVRAVNFDGLDLVWNTPNLDETGKPMADKDVDFKNYILLLKNLRYAFESEKEKSGKDRLLLTVAVAADYIGGYNVPELDKYVDYISLVNFMSLNGFDGLVGQKGVTRFMAGLYKSKSRSDKSPDQSVTCNLCIEEGFICEFDPEALVPYAHKDGLWVSFEDSYSLQYKLMWLKNNDLAGAAVWSMDSDDFDDTCRMGTYPLLSVVSECLLSDFNCEPVNKNNYPSAKASDQDSLSDSALAPNPSITTIIAVVAVFLLKSTLCF